MNGLNEQEMQDMIQEKLKQEGIPSKILLFERRFSKNGQVLPHLFYIVFHLLFFN